MIRKLLVYRHSLQILPTESLLSSSTAGGGGSGNHATTTTTTGITTTGFSDLFESSTSIFSGARDRFQGLKGVENVYTQHSPRLQSTLQMLLRGRLKDSQFPFLDPGIDDGDNGGGEGGGKVLPTKDKPQEIIIFIVGGLTFEEAKMIAQSNASSPGVRIVLGGTTVLNAESFWEDVNVAVNLSWTSSSSSSSLTSSR